MKHPIARVVSAVLGGIAAMAALAALAIAASAGGARLIGAGWLVPLVAGSSVGLLSWLLLSTAPSVPSPTDKRAMTPCPQCGIEVLTDWRLCPYCGGTKESEAGQTERATS